MEKKFESISSIMKRLGVSPRIFLLQCATGSLNIMSKDREYIQIESVIPEEFEFSIKAQNITQYEMFIYNKGNSFLFRKTPMESKLQKQDSWNFKGFPFTSKEHNILVIKFGNKYYNTKSAVKKLNTRHRLSITQRHNMYNKRTGRYR